MNATFNSIKAWEAKKKKKTAFAGNTIETQTAEGPAFTFHIRFLLRCPYFTTLLTESDLRISTEKSKDKYKEKLPAELSLPSFFFFNYFSSTGRSARKKRGKKKKKESDRSCTNDNSSRRGVVGIDPHFSASTFTASGLTELARRMDTAEAPCMLTANCNGGTGAGHRARHTSLSPL